MRPLVCSVIIAAILLLSVSVSDGRPDAPSASSVAIYDPSPSHLWNRLYTVLLVRQDRDGNLCGEDSLDALLWINSQHLLEPRSHARAIKVLDEFLEKHGEMLISDPLKRVMLQRDLWAVFDWTTQQSNECARCPDYSREKTALQTRLAEVLRRLALTSEEIKQLPDNYRQAITEGVFATDVNLSDPKRPFLPPDLFDPHGTWAGITSSPDFDDVGVAKAHTFSSSGRSTFLVFVRLPGGHKATMDYFQTLWNFPEPWVPEQNSADQVITNPDLPSFPPGTEVALVRKMNSFDKQGDLVVTPITESIQIRVYRRITPTPEHFVSGNPSETIRNSGQYFYQVRLSRPLLFSNTNGGLRATTDDEREFSTFQRQGGDEIEALDENPKLRDHLLPALQTCRSCHSGGGIRSFNSRGALFRPNRKQVAPEQSDYGSIYWGDESAITWKQNRYDWGLLNGYWKAGSSLP